ncbi:chromosome segregation protein SMC, partial [Streptomyces sp. Wh19]|nr:chromosome segregation protein SMC [Streptomyces sp. Wh19]
ADAVAVTDPATAAEAIRLLRKQDAGRAALLLGGVRAGVPDQGGAPGVGGADGVAGAGGVGDSGGAGGVGAAGDSGGAGGASAAGDSGGAAVVHVPGQVQGSGGVDGAPLGAQVATVAVGGAPAVADLVRGPVELMGAVRRLVRDMVVVGTLEDAEDLVAVHTELTAVTAEGDILSAHFAHGGSAGAPSLLEVQASVDEAAAQLEELAVRCAELTEAQRIAGERRRAGAALVEELGERRRAA